MSTDNQLTWCKCTSYGCIDGGPDGTSQTKRAARNHRNADDAHAGRSHNLTHQQLAPTTTIPSQLPTYLPAPILITHPPSPSESSNSILHESPEQKTSPLIQPYDDTDFDFDDLFDPASDQATDDEHHIEPSTFVWLSDSASDTDADWQFFRRSFCPPSDDNHSDVEIDPPSDLDTEDIVTDPLFVPRSSLFDPPEAREVSDANDMVTSKLDLPLAFYEHPSIRNAYVRVFVGCAFESMTHNAAQLMLEGFVMGFRAGNIPGVERMARTLSTVEKRLGVSTQDFITYLFVCDTCWELQLPTALYNLKSPACTAPDCTGQFYTVKRLADGKEKRTPSKIVPYVDPQQSITHLLSRPGKYEQLSAWRGPDDVPGRRPPTEARGYDAFADLDKPMKDIHDGWGWRAIQAGLERRRTGQWKIEDVDVQGLHQQFVALPCGLVWQINIDWFQAIKGGLHSTGAFYMTLCNNLRNIRFLREETVLVMIFPGPHEPTLEDINKITRPFIDSMKRQYNGVKYHIHAHPDPKLVHSQINSNVSDLLASDKISGLPSHNSKFYMCPRCYTHFYELTEHTCFNPTRLKKRDDWRYLKYAFRARDGNQKRAADIFRKRGIRWSIFDELPNWMPGETSVVEFMHCVLLCLVKHLSKNILYKNGLLGMEDGPILAKMNKVFSNIIWPPSVSRLPPSIARGAGSVKADQWRSQISVLFIVLFVGWEVEGEIPDIDAPSSPPGTKIAAAQAASEKLVRARKVEYLLSQNPDATEEEIEEINQSKMDRSLPKHYHTIVEFSASVRILTSQSISPNEVKRGCGALSQSIQSWARMGCHLTPYFHFAIHMEPQFLQFGPSYGWWAFPYERNNGFLGRFNHNGHSGGELEGTMMRGWWKSIFIHELITNLEGLIDPTDADKDSLNVLRSYLNGGTKERRGTLQTYLAQLAAEGNTDPIRFTQYHQKLVLRTVPGLYRLVFEYLQVLWQDTIHLLSDTSLTNNKHDENFMGTVASFSHLWINKRRYGAATAHRGKSGQYAYIDNRIAVRIQYLFTVTQSRRTGSDLTTSLALVSRFTCDANIPEFPWELRAKDLGVQAWNADRLKRLEVVPISRISGQFILVPINIRCCEIWITVAWDHETPEGDGDEAL